MISNKSIFCVKKYQDEAVQEVVEFMNTYSISQDDFDIIVELSKFQGHPNPLDGILPAVKAAPTKAYKEGSKTRMIRAADFVTIPGMKKVPKKRIAALLEPSDDVIGENNDDTLVQSKDENSSDTEDLGNSTPPEMVCFRITVVDVQNRRGLGTT
ncbi:hypothetical protein ACFX13_028689 [Malus domestica]